ncbi:zinc-dependent metalloprotease [Glycomyces buryatensis]|uniref:Coenzyme F420 biosynthesis-associated protein n=1 Tax=Glycomyces buryatensis TaxID=2570927 RepID=A0A4S8QAM7_9ACTN|nr:zinc-dependent metalloprotease [Glycomyces buryatensis]THV41320.1 coenzyme F420 biosynthesis-associated protein [Glycomyces buryatensis]
MAPPVANQMLPSVDWRTAASCSRAFTGGGPRLSRAGAIDVVADLHLHARTAIDLVTDYTGLTPAVQARVEVVDRARWSDINIAGFRRLLSDLGAVQPETESASAAAKVTGVQAGAVLAFLSSRVLGQFETFSTDHGRLLFVAPNVVEVERRLRLPTREFRLWIAVHEAAHLTQFTAVPWMSGHFHGLIRTFFDAAEPEQSSTAQFGRAVRRAVAASSNDPAGSPEGELPGVDILAAVTSPQQREAISKIQALMTLLEGHAESVMDGVGRTSIDHVGLLRRRFDRRRANPSPIQRFLRQLLGLDAKLRQYAAGRRFVDQVVAAHGVSGFNRVWEDPSHLPTEAEIDHPERWSARVLHEPSPHEPSLEGRGPEVHKLGGTGA